jgi:hypothetical protein
MQFRLKGRHTVSPLRWPGLADVHKKNRPVCPEVFAGSKDRLRLPAASEKFKYTDVSEIDFVSILKIVDREDNSTSTRYINTLYGIQGGEF